MSTQTSNGTQSTGTKRKRGNGAVSRGNSTKQTTRKTKTNNDLDPDYPEEDQEEELMGRADVETLFLDGSEGYFDQHKSREKISTTPFSRAPSLEYKEFIEYIEQSRSFNTEAREFLVSLYHTMFTQWYFELTQGFSLLFYGVGSKRTLLLDFMTTIPKEIPVLVANGYNPSVSFKEILNSLVPVLAPDYSGPKFPKNTPDLLQALLDYLDETRPPVSDVKNIDFYLPKVILLVNNINGESFRSSRVQNMLSRLVSIKEVWLVASIDNINAPMMWDAAKLAIYNFLWHDVTTFESYAIETSFDDPLSLGMVRTAAGSKGVEYVLSSLTPKARGLYKVLIYLQIEIMSFHGSDSENAPGSSQTAVELSNLYKQCISEFLVSNEMNFRTMLTEFIDHKMITLTKDSSGTEIVFIPYTKEFMEKIIEGGHLDN